MIRSFSTEAEKEPREWIRWVSAEAEKSPGNGSDRPVRNGKRASGKIDRIDQYGSRIKEAGIVEIS